MLTSFTSSQLDQLRRDAQRLRKQDGSLTHYQALDHIAVKNGYRNWSLLTKHRTAPATTAVPATPSSAKPPSPPAAPPDGRPDGGRQRYYLHGDQLEGDPARYYCAQCDVFFNAEHFASHGPHTGERLLERLERWNKRDGRSQMNWRRPDDAPNLLHADALAARAEYQALRAQFSDWLLAQRKRTQAGERRDDVGLWAMGLAPARGLPKTPKSLQQLRDHYRRYGAQHFEMEALDAAWSEFRSQLASRQR